MQTWKLGLTMLLAGCALEAGEATDGDSEALTSTTASAVERTPAAHGGSVTRIRVNGRSSDVLLSADGAAGYLFAGRDLITNTTAVDFSYASPDPTNPNRVVLVQGAGAVPNSAYTLTSSGARLIATTTFPITRCVVDQVTGDVACAPGAAVALDVTWTRNGYARVQEKVQRREQTGPVTTKFKGEYDQRSALVDGAIGGFVLDDNTGNLLDTQNTTITREIEVAP